MAATKEVINQYGSVVSDGILNYSDITQPTDRIIFEELVPKFKKAMEQIRCEGDSPFVICDFGAADGKNSTQLIRTCIDIIRNRFGKSKPIQIYYEDQVTNDFNCLFRRLHGFTEECVKSYVFDYEDVYIYGSGTEFYRRCFPENYIDFCFSIKCLTWLTKRPENVLNFIPSVADDAEKMMWAEIAAVDWETFLLCRAREMKSGAQLIICSFSTDEYGRYATCSEDGKSNIDSLFIDSWKYLLDTGMATMEEYKKTCFNNYYRTTNEYAAPFENEDSKVIGAGLRLVSITTNFFRDELNASYKQAIKNGKTPSVTPSEYANTLTNYTMVWADSALFSGISEERGPEDKKSVKKAFWNFFEKNVSGNPEAYNRNKWMAVIHIRKE